MRKLIIFVSVLNLLTLSGISAKTKTGGKISKDTVWLLKNSPYIVNKTLTVRAGAKLTIEPGVEIIVPFNDEKTKFIIEGSLTAKGRKNGIISFRSSLPKAGAWSGIVLKPAPGEAQSVIEYCRIENAGSAISCFQASPVIQNNILAGNEVAVVCEDHSSPSIVSNTINNNGIAEAFTSAVHCTLWSNPVISKNIFEKNYGNAIYCEAYSSPVISENKILTLLGSNIICASFSSPQIIKNDITGGTAEFGIIAYHSSPFISENKISGKRLYGITAVYSSPVISGNTIFQNYLGIFCIRSSPLINENSISKCDIAVSLAENSQPEFKKNNFFSNGAEKEFIRNEQPLIIPGSQMEVKYSESQAKKPLVLFQSFSTGNWNIGLLNGESREWRLLSENGFHSGSSAWSPDGNTIAFMSKKENNWDIYFMDTTGKNVKNITNTRRIDEFPPIWSPDGEKLAFEEDAGICQTVVLDLKTRETRVINLRNVTMEYPGLYPLVFIWFP